MKIRTRLILTFASCSLIPIALVGYLCYRSAIQGVDRVKDAAAEGFSQRAQAQLVALRDVKKLQIEQYCDNCCADLQSLIGTVDALRCSALSALECAQDDKRADIENAFQMLCMDLEALANNQKALELFQALRVYHSEMGTQPDQPYDVSTSKYKEVCGKYGDFLQEYITRSGCRAAYLVCMAQRTRHVYHIRQG